MSQASRHVRGWPSSTLQRLSLQTVVKGASKDELIHDKATPIAPK
jgi:hypothetical protein